jgi:serine/threonine protein phosphatase 1
LALVGASNLPLKSSFHIGDIHGMSRELKQILSFIETFSTERNIDPIIIFHGDIVDRGPDSRGAMELVLQALEKWPGSIALFGNHDYWFQQAILKDGFFPDSTTWYGRWGGVETVDSYTDIADPKALFAHIRQTYPRHVQLLAKMSSTLSVQRGPFFCCHAGINPKLPISKQTAKDLLFIADDFANCVDPKLPPVIHGHMIFEDGPVVTENRISIDTGSFYTGRLTTCLVTPAKTSLRFFQTRNGGVREISPIAQDRGHGTLLDKLPELFADFKA